MQLGYKYKLKVTVEQEKRIGRWIDMLRANYNYNLSDREQVYSERFVMGAYCDIRTQAECCPLTCFVSKSTATSETGQPFKTTRKGETKYRNTKEIQQGNLPSLKRQRPWYQDVDSTALQRNQDRLESAYLRYFQGLGKYPKRKNRSNFKSFTISNVVVNKNGKTTSQTIVVSGNRVRLGKLGWLRFHNSRSIPDGWIIKSATIRIKADGIYVILSVRDDSVPSFPILEKDEVKSAIGLDMGITKLVHCSDGTQYDNPRFSTNKKIKRRMRIRQRSLSRKKKGSGNRKKAGKKIAKLHQVITNKRDAYQWKRAAGVSE